MFGYITSILGFQGLLQSANTGPGHASSPSTSQPQASCRGYGWSLPRQDIRLRVSNKNSSLVRIFGFPPQEDYPESIWYPPPVLGRDGPYIQYLLSESPASVKYVVGDDWRSRLRSGPEYSPTELCEKEVVLRPSTSSGNTCDAQATSNDDPAVLAEERAHSLRMRRCGAVAICAEDDIRHYDAEQMNIAPKYLFGWPATGVFWVLRPPWKQAAPEKSKDHLMIDEERMNDMMESALRDEIYHALADKVKRQEDMEDVCRLLEETGARFYAAIEDSPEAVELGFTDF